MRNLAVLALLACLALPACVPLATLSTGGGQSSASLGPDSVSVSSSVSTLPARIKAGLDWLWASYTRLRESGALPGLDDLRADIVDLEAVAARGDLVAALSLYGRARDRVTRIVEAASK